MFKKLKIMLLVGYCNVYFYIILERRSHTCSLRNMLFSGDDVFTIMDIFFIVILLTLKIKMSKIGWKTS